MQGAKFLLLVAREADRWALLPRKARTCIWRPDRDLHDRDDGTLSRSLARVYSRFTRLIGWDACTRLSR